MNQVKIGSIISYIQTGINILIALLYTPVMIRILGRSEYGLYNTISSIIAIVALLNLGFGSTYIKYYSGYRKDNNRQAIYKLNGMFLCIFLLIAAVAGVCGFFLSSNLNLVFSTGLTEAEYVVAKKLMLLLTGNLMFTFAANVFTCIISAHEKFVFLKLLGVLKTVISPLVTIPVLLAGYGSIGMVVVTVTLSLLCDLLYVLFVLCNLKEKFAFKGYDPALFKELFRYTSLIAIHLIVDQINWNVDKILLGRFKGTETVALYSVGYSLYAHYISVGLTMVNMFVPRVHKIVAECENEPAKLTTKLTALFTRIGRIQYLVLAPIVVGFVLFGRSFIIHWAGAEYEQAYYVALLLIISGSIDLIQNIGIEMQRAQKLHAFRAIIYAVMAGINVVLSVILCQEYGAIGCAVGTAISLIVVQGIVINIYYYKKCHINVVTFWKSILLMTKGLTLPTVFGVVICCIKSSFSLLELMICIGCFVLLYIPSVYLMGMTASEKESIRNILGKVKKRLFTPNAH